MTAAPTAATPPPLLSLLLLLLLVVVKPGAPVALPLTSRAFSPHPRTVAHGDAQRCGKHTTAARRDRAQLALAARR